MTIQDIEELQSKLAGDSTEKLREITSNPGAYRAEVVAAAMHVLRERANGEVDSTPQRDARHAELLQKQATERLRVLPPAPTNILAILFDVRGRVNRRTFWTWFGMTSITTFMILNFHEFHVLEWDYIVENPKEFLFPFLVALNLYMSTALLVKRLHDIGESGWRLMDYRFIEPEFFRAGDPFTNQYGYPPP